MDVITLNPKPGAAERSRFVERGRRLEYFTILWNSLEALAALISGFIAGSVALVGFGLDSLIEVTSGAALLWRLHQDDNIAKRERAERLDEDQVRRALGDAIEDADVELRADD